MSFAVRNLSVLAYANGFTLWHYKASGDSLREVSHPGYFDDAVDMLSGGDMLMVSSSTGSQVLCVAVGQQGLLTAPLG